MGRTIGPDKACAVHRKTYWQILQRDIMHDLVKPALEEGRVNRAEGLIAIRREAACKGDSMLFGNPDNKHTFGEDLAEFFHARTARHSRRDTDNFIVLAGFGNQALSKDFRIGRRIGFGFRLLARDDVEFRPVSYTHLTLPTKA